MAGLVFFLVLTILVTISTVRLDLVVDKRCGQLSCDRHMYCSRIDLTCKDCSNICQKDHNFDAEACTQGCQDYLHDSTYVRRDDEGPVDNSKLKEEVKQLRSILTATLTLVVLILIGIIIVLSIQAVRWCKNNKVIVQKLKNIFRQKKTEVTSADAKTLANPNARLGDGNKPVELRLDMPSTRCHSELPTPATLSTNISRRPAEDSTLDYAAYDNPAMRRSGSSNGGGSPSSVIGNNRDRLY